MVSCWFDAIPFAAFHGAGATGKMGVRGQAADDAVRRKYVGKSVASYFPRGAANPIMYVNCGY
jgi:hypothetical protein